MYILRALAFLFLTQAVLAQKPTPILPDPKLTPGDTFDVTAQDVCVPGYAKKVRAVPAWLKRQAYAEYGITEYKTGDYEVDHLIPHRQIRWRPSFLIPRLSPVSHGRTASECALCRLVKSTSPHGRLGSVISRHSFGQPATMPLAACRLPLRETDLSLPR